MLSVLGKRRDGAQCMNSSVMIATYVVTNNHLGFSWGHDLWWVSQDLVTQYIAVIDGRLVEYPLAKQIQIHTSLFVARKC
jgi:hypothetical protein